MIWYLLAALAATGTALALSGDSNPIVGRWLGANFGVVFNDDGSFASRHADGTIRTGRYSVSGSSLLMQPTDLDSPIMNSFSVVGNKLTVTGVAGNSEVFTRQA